MLTTIQVFVLLVAIVAGGGFMARRLTLPPAILLVMAGIGLSLLPGFPEVTLDPEIALTVILPPLLYWAGVSMSWPEFKRNIRPIALMAVGAVAVTTVAVAAVSHYLLGLPWAVSFVLGAIISPPDVVAPMAITRPLGLPRRLMAVLEGEGLVNDATALVLYRFAVSAVATGTFSVLEASGTFVAILVGELAYGLAIGWLTLRLRRWLRDPRIEITVALLTPYLCFWPPHDLGGSGVLATVAAGLYASWNGPLLISSATRLQGSFFWDLYVYLIEGLVFLITGLQARAIIERVDGQWEIALTGALIITAVVVLVRFLWVFPIAALPRGLSGLGHPGWRAMFALSFTGVRGVVSLAAALAIPLTIGSGEPFPHRDLILFLVFFVIVATLVGEGLVMPSLVRWLRLDLARRDEEDEERGQEARARLGISDMLLTRLDEAERVEKIEEAVLARIRHAVQDTRAHWQAHGDGASAGLTADAIEQDLIDAQRVHIFNLLRRGELTDEARRRLEHELDLAEASLHGHGSRHSH